jgi:hypothetical protein
MAEVGGGGRAELDRVARLLMDAWERAEGTPVGMSYVATFVDLARAVIADRARLQRAVEGAAGAGGGVSPLVALRAVVETWASDRVEHTGDASDRLLASDAVASVRSGASEAVVLVLVGDRLEAMGGVWVEEDRAWSGVRWRRMPSGR